MNVYVVGSHDRVETVSHALKRQGFKITHDWNEMVARDARTDRPESRLRYANACIGGVREADIVVFLMTSEPSPEVSFVFGLACMRGAMIVCGWEDSLREPSSDALFTLLTEAHVLDEAVPAVLQGIKMAEKNAC